MSNKQATTLNHEPEEVKKLNEQPATEEALGGPTLQQLSPNGTHLDSQSVRSVSSSVAGLRDDSEEATKRIAKHQKKWNRRFRVFFFCLGYKRNKDSIADVASIFAEFFSDLNVPSSDVAAGFVLLSKYQDAQRQWIVKNDHSNIEQYLSGIPISDNTKFLDISTAEDSHLINDLVYYMNYSLAIFGWPLHVVDDPCMLCCICPYLSLSRCCSRGKKSKQKRNKNKKKQDETDQSEKPESETGTTEPNQNPHSNQTPPAAGGANVPGKLINDSDMPVILNDNCCGCNFASAEKRLAAHNYDVVYCSYHVDVNVIPFLVVADHSKQAIVVALRGSMSLSDMVTDMNGQVDRIPIENCPPDWLCHRGITRAAANVKTKLIQENILARAFNCRPDLNSQSYNLVLCGHSLGAGAAALLGILMRPLYPQLKAYLYSPPGGILSLPAVEYTKKFAVGIILGNDTVPRLGVAQLERLRYHTLLSLKSSQRSTSKILAKALCPSCCFGSNVVDYEPSQSLDLLHGTRGRSFDFNGFKITFQVQPQLLYVPGRLIHVVKNHSFKSQTRRLFKEPIYQAIWTDNTMYDRILISEGMFMDHLPNNLMHAMKMLFSKTLPGRRESKSSPSSASYEVSLAPDNSHPEHNAREHGTSITQSDVNANPVLDCGCTKGATIVEQPVRSKPTTEVTSIHRAPHEKAVDNQQMYPDLDEHTREPSTDDHTDDSSQADLDVNGNEICPTKL